MELYMLFIIIIATTLITLFFILSLLLPFTFRRRKIEKIQFLDLDRSTKALGAWDFFYSILKMENISKAFHYVEILFLVIDGLFILIGVYVVNHGEAKLPEVSTNLKDTMLLLFIEPIILWLITLFLFLFAMYMKKKENKRITEMLNDLEKAKLLNSAQKDFFKSDNAKDQDLVLKGNLSSFDGVYSNDDLEQSIADSGFTLYAYKPEDYFQNRTSVFPRITGKGNDWNFWSGSSHMQYKLNENKLPRKIGDYYEAYFIGVNQIAVEGKEISVLLVPENMEGPNGDISSEKRIIFGQTNQISFREYQDKWWEKYTTDSVEKQDLDIEAIMKGDYATLAGVWKNGEGLEIIITADGKTNRNESISPNSISNSKFPTLNIRSGNSGAMIALFKIGFRNPYGDQSDSSRPRLVFGQNIGNVPADQYYYKQ